MDDLTAKGLANRTRVGIMAVGRHPLRRVTNDSNGLLEKALGRLQVSLLVEQGIDQIAILIDGAIEIAPFPFDVDVGFINVPGWALLAHVVSPAVAR